MSTVPYESQKMNTRELTTQLLEAHGGAFNNLMHPEGHLEGVLTFGPPGIGKTQSVRAAAHKIAADNGGELVIYRPGVRREPGKNQILFVHMSMAGMTSGGVLGFPTVSANDRTQETDTAEQKLEKQRRFVSQQVIPEIWRAGMEFESAIYLFDEITHVISQEAMLSLLSEGFYGETQLAKRTLFIATANEGVSDGTLQQKLSTAFRNRFTSYYIRAEVKQWREDFANKVVHPALLAYASMYADRLENFKMPEHNLLNFTSLRGITLMSDDLTYFEARNFRARSANGIADPRGEMKEDVPMTAEHEKVLTRLAFGRLGSDAAATDFVNMYTLAYKTVMPEIRKAIAGNFDAISPEFKTALASDSEAALAKQKAAMAGKSSNEKLRESQQDIAKSFTYVDYAPRMFLETLENLPRNPRIKEDAKKRFPQKYPGQTWPADDQVPPEMLRAYGNALMDHFLKAVMLLPPNLQIVCIHHIRDLGSTQEMKERLKPFENAAGAPGEESKMLVVMGLMMNHLTTKRGDPAYDRIYKAFEQNSSAQSVLSGLGV